MTPSCPLTYELTDSIATITMDDGKANVMSMAMLEALAGAFDRAESDGAVVVLAGRDGMFSGGYDVAMFTRSPAEVATTVRTGGELIERMLSFPLPIVAACTGHAIAQGAFTLLGADVRVGCTGRWRIGLNEVTIGMTIPHYGVEAARHRLTPPWFDRVTLTGALFSPDEALAAGFLDRLVEPAEIRAEARAEAEQLTALDMTAHAATKQRVRAGVLAAIRDGLDADFPTDAGAAANP